MNDSPSGAHSDDTDRRIGLLTTDLDLVVKSWDKSLERMTGIPADTVKGRRLEEVVPDLHARGLLDVLREPLVSGATRCVAPLAQSSATCMPERSRSAKRSCKARR